MNNRLCNVVFRNHLTPNLKRLLRPNIAALCKYSNTPRPQKRQISNIESEQLEKEPSLIRKLLRKVPFFNIDKTRLMTASYLLYETIADEVDYLEFFTELDLPDTFYSWFVITELHIWMLSARAMAEGDDGRLLRNYVVEALWNDVAQRIKKLGGQSNPAAAREQVTELSEQLQAALIAYDEGLQSDDMVLAGALWRRFYQNSDVQPENLDVLVRYVRKQMRLLDHLSKEDLLESKRVHWIKLK